MILKFLNDDGKNIISICYPEKELSSKDLDNKNFQKFAISLSKLINAYDKERGNNV